jgi:hypothetical protein
MNFEISCDIPGVYIPPLKREFRATATTMYTVREYDAEQAGLRVRMLALDAAKSAELHGAAVETEVCDIREVM